MRFYVPGAEDDAQVQRVVTAVEEFTGFKLPSVPIQSMEFVHDGSRVTATVGDSIDQRYDAGGIVVMILEKTSDNPTCYAVCTTNRGVLKGEPVYVGPQNVRNTVYFNA